MYHSFLIHSSVDGYLGCFHVLAIIDSAEMNIAVHVSLSDLVSSVCMPKSGISGSYYSSISSFLRNLLYQNLYISSIQQFNSFMTIFTQIIHKKQTQTIKQTVPGQSMETHISILVQRIPMARGACWTTVHRLQKSDTVEQLSTALKVEQQYHLHHHCIYASVQTAQA